MIRTLRQAQGAGNYGELSLYSRGAELVEAPSISSLSKHPVVPFVSTGSTNGFDFHDHENFQVAP